MANRISLRNSIALAASLAAVFWLLKFYEIALGISLHNLGIYPRTEGGLLGILTAPLIHGSWQHLIGNTLPTVLLGSMLIYGYPKSRYWALAGIWILSGLGVWFFARSSFHFGASGITHGMFFYLFIGGILRRDRRSAAILMIAFYMYGGMLLTIFPGDPGVSFESHFFGALAGAFCAYIFRSWDPKPVHKPYSWQHKQGDSETMEEDPVIGDQWKIDRELK